MDMVLECVGANLFAPVYICGLYANNIAATLKLSTMS